MRIAIRIRGAAVVLPLTLVFMLACATSAAAKRTVAPPGNSGVGQYVEVIPSAAGGVPVDSAKQSGGPVLSASTKSRLDAQGAEGSAVAAFAQSTGVPAHGGASGTRGEGSHSPAASSGSASPPAATNAAAISSTGGLGFGLPLALAAAALVALALALKRRRSH